MVRAIYFKQFAGKGIFEVKFLTTSTDMSKDISKTEFFFSFEDARGQLTKERRLWLIRELTDYVKHKSIIFRSSAGDYYRVPSRLDALTRLENAINILPTLPNQRFFKAIIDSVPLLRAILPHPSNPSTEASKTTILQIESVALDEINNVHGLLKPTCKTEIYY